MPAFLAQLSVPVRTIGLLVPSNVFMTFASYAHLRDPAARPSWIAALASRGVALFEHLLQVPANRIGCGTSSLGQPEIVQEVITLAVFVPSAVLCMGRPLKLDSLRAGPGSQCDPPMGAVCTIFRS